MGVTKCVVDRTEIGRAKLWIHIQGDPELKLSSTNEFFSFVPSSRIYLENHLPFLFLHVATKRHKKPSVGFLEKDTAMGLSRQFPPNHSSTVVHKFHGEK